MNHNAITMSLNYIILSEMIKKDMEQKGISSYYISDQVAEAPALIEIGANEVGYVYYLSLKHAEPFSVQLLSATEKVFYTAQNTRAYYRGKITETSANYNFVESTLITRHWSNIRVAVAGKPVDFLLKYVKVRILDSHEKD